MDSHKEEDKSQTTTSSQASTITIGSNDEQDESEHNAFLSQSSNESNFSILSFTLSEELQMKHADDVSTPYIIQFALPESFSGISIIACFLT